MNVSARARMVKQPKGGYLSIRQFASIPLGEGEPLAENENVHPSIVGMVTDYFTRLKAGADKKSVFDQAVSGAREAERFGCHKGAEQKAIYLASNINAVNALSITNACKLATYEVWSRSGFGGSGWKGPDETNPDSDTIHNIEILINRTSMWLDVVKPIVKTGFTFFPKENATKERLLEVMRDGKGSFGGYTRTVHSGDGDYLCKQSMWEMKVSKDKPTTKNTLQLLMYWIMGMHSGQDIYKDIQLLGFVNPRRAELYVVATSEIDQSTIASIEKDVICY